MKAVCSSKVSPTPWNKLEKSKEVHTEEMTGVEARDKLRKDGGIEVSKRAFLIK